MRGYDALLLVRIELLATIAVNVGVDRVRPRSPSIVVERIRAVVRLLLGTRLLPQLLSHDFFSLG